MLRLLTGAVLAIVLLAPTWSWAVIAMTAAAPNRDIDQGESTSISPPASLAAGDTWVIIVSADNDAGAGQPGVPAGFTAVDAGLQDATDGTYTRAFWKIAGSSESAVTSTAVSGNWYDVVTYSIRITGAHASAPIGNIGNNNPAGGGANLVPQSITIASTGNAAIAWIAGSASIAPVTKPTSMTSLGTDTTNWPAISVAYEVGLTSGTYAPAAWTNTSADPAYTQMFEIIQSAGGGGPDVTPFYKRRIK